MAAKGDVVVTIGADAAGLEKDLGRAVDGAKTQLGRLGPAARSAGAEVISLGDRMKAFAREQRSDAGAARFFVHELAQIVPISGAAKGALTQLGGALVGGGIVGIGIAAATAGIGMLVNHFRESAAAAEEAKKKAEELAEQQRRAYEEEKQREAERRARRGSALGTTIDDLTKRVALEERGGNDEAARRRIEHEQKIADLRRQYNAAIDAGQFEIQAALKYQIDLENQLFGAIERNIAAREEEKRKADISHATADVGAVPETKTVVGDFLQPEDVEAAERDRLASIYRANEAIAEGKKLQAEHNAEVARGAAAAQQWGNAIGAAFGQMATGQMSAREGIISIMQMTIREATGYAIAAAINAGKSQAGIPVVGPVLAISAAGAVLSAMMGMMASMPSAAGGMKVPEDMLAFIHEDERVLPARYSKGLDRLVEGAERGTVGGGITVNVGGAIISDRDLEQTLTSRNGGLARAQRKMQRRRRG